MVFNDAEFEAAEMAAWSDMARRILKGAAPDSLDRTDEDGLVTKLFYPANADDQAAADHLLPAFPHQHLAGGWQVCQPLAEDATNTDVHEALSGGATALSVQASSSDDLAGLLGGVVLPASASASTVRRRDPRITAPCWRLPVTRPGPSISILALIR
ncbi:MAG: hypothetical protein VX113_01425 [Pseudomonadota bacterium]|nr:hypothetical protein [Pseudomonadota bacterium]